jgi:hypothetical protein
MGELATPAICPLTKPLLLALQIVFIFVAISVVLVPIGVVCLVFGLQVRDGPR